MSNDDLIKIAASVVKIRETKSGFFGDVGCALVSENGIVFTGICADIGSNTFCAEKSAIGAMITAGEYKVKKIVAVWKDEHGAVFVIPPCGSCRQLIFETDADNLETDVILDRALTVKLKELLPYYDWWQKQTLQ